ncbi:MAG: CvpA family protein [Campylobacterota bacterium]|nr:CvpA family protein [Campylobacterota bacterium]
MENFSMVDFNYFDITIGSIVLILSIKGFINGFIKEVFGLIGLVAGVYFASRFSQTAATFIDTNFIHIENTAILTLLGFITILIIIWLSATIIGAILSKLTSVSGLGFLNRLFGFIVGGGKYFIIFALIVTALSNVTLIKDNLEKYVKDSLLYPYLKETGSSIIKLNPTVLGLEKISPKKILKDVVKLDETNTSTDIK